MIQVLAFSLFAAVVIASAVFVILSRNPVHSVLWLILAFFNAAGLMVLVGAEFIAIHTVGFECIGEVLQNADMLFAGSAVNRNAHIPGARLGKAA